MTAPLPEYKGPPLSSQEQWQSTNKWMGTAQAKDDVHEYGNIAHEYGNKAEIIRRRHWEIGQKLGKVTIPGKGPTIEASQQFLGELKESVNKTTDSLSELEKQARKHKASVDAFNETVEPAERNIDDYKRNRTEVTKHIADSQKLPDVQVTFDDTPGAERYSVVYKDPMFQNSSVLRTGESPLYWTNKITEQQKVIDKAVADFKTQQVEIVRAVNKIPWEHGLGGNRRPGQPAPTGIVPSGPSQGTSSATRGASAPLFPTSSISTPAGGGAPGASTSGSDAGDTLANATPLANQQGVGAPMAGAMVPMGMPGQTGGMGQPGTGQPNVKALPDDEFQKLLNNVSGPSSKAGSTPIGPTAPKASSGPITFPTAGLNQAGLTQTPSLTNQAGAPTTASGAAKTGLSAGGGGGTSRGTGMPMMGGMPMGGMPMGGGAGAGGLGKSDRPKIANADPKEIYGEEIKHTDPIVTPRRQQET
jgi:hypothetical protein